jgi:hypothetical protein
MQPTRVRRGLKVATWCMLRVTQVFDRQQALGREFTEMRCVSHVTVALLSLWIRRLLIWRRCCLSCTCSSCSGASNNVYSSVRIKILHHEFDQRSRFTMASVRVLTAHEIARDLASLDALLRGLPAALPLDVYEFDSFALDPDRVEDYGSPAAAFNRQLEVTLCPRGRINGFELCGRGPGIESIVPLLRDFIAQFPQDCTLQKWIADIADAAKRAGAVRVQGSAPRSHAHVCLLRSLDLFYLRIHPSGP